MLNKTCIVAGVGPGIGAAAVRAFAKEGYAVAMVARRLDTMTVLQKELGSNVHPFVCDLGNENDILTASKAIKSSLPPASVMVLNCGGTFNPKPFLESDFMAMLPSLKVQLIGSAILCQQFIPEFLKTNEGSIIFTGATAAMRGSANFATIAMPKFGIRALSQSLAREFGPKGIHVSHVIIDGVVESQRGRMFLKNASKDGLLDPSAIADEYVKLTKQHRSTWTQELDLRPFEEKF